MRSILVTLLPLLAASLSAQQPQFRAPQGAAELVNISHNAGLQADGPGKLLGGGPDYRVHFAHDGMRFHPALGNTSCDLQHLQLRAPSVRRGDHDVLAFNTKVTPAQRQHRASYAHAPGMIERYDVGVDGVALSWRFENKPAGDGDLVVRYALDSSLADGRSNRDGGLDFLLREPDGDAACGVSIGGVTGIDANGASVAGTVRQVGSALEFSLPQSFVESAHYPLVLDPLIGTIFPITNGPINDDGEPDAAFDFSTSSYLVTYMRQFTASVRLVRAQRVDENGALLGSTIFIPTIGTCDHARVANLSAYDRFGITFEQTDGLNNSVRFCAIDAATGAITHQTQIAGSTGVQLYASPDIAGSYYPVQNSTSRFVVAYEDNIFNEIRARAVFFNTSDTLVSPNPATVVADTGGIGSNYTEPSICKCRGSDGLLMIASRRFSGIGPTRGVRVSAFRTSTMATVASTTLGNSTSDAVNAPAVDGIDGTWVVAWQRAASSTAAPGIRRQTLRYSTNSGFDAGPIETFGGSVFAQAKAPSLGYAPGRTWIGYQYFQGIGVPTTTLRAAAIDSRTSEWCGVEINELAQSQDQRIVVATAASGGAPSLDNALAVMAINTNVYAQLLTTAANSGTIADLGGGCGSAGAQYFSESPSIGASSMVCGITGLPPTAIATVFNLAVPNGSLPCGPCVWTPFESTVTKIVTTHTDSVAFPLPCQTSLIGAQLETQWTTLDPIQSPCATFPQLVLSNRALLTIGN